MARGVIGAPGRADMALDEGRFAAGSAGTDRLSGSFHGLGRRGGGGSLEDGAHVAPVPVLLDGEPD